jgi:Mn-containing catalase
LHYFTQAFVLREKNPKMYDLFVDIAAEELSHLEMVGSMITMLLDGLDDDLKVATQRCDWLPAVASATVTSKRFTRSRSTRCSWC